MAKAKTADLRQAMLGKTDSVAPSAGQLPRAENNTSREMDRHYRPGRQGKANVTGYFPPTVKRQLRVLAAEQDTTIQALLGQALNDLFAKYGKPEVVPVEGAVSPGRHD